MLSKANVSVIDMLRLYAEADLPVAFVVPTPTGLKKSILDATEPVRSFLSEQRLHDYETQPQGQDAKVILPAVFLSGTKATTVEVSLYRPATKQGDPRLWISGLPHFAGPYDLVALTVARGQLLILNMSEQATSDSLSARTGAIWSRLSAGRLPMTSEASELLGNWS